MLEELKNLEANILLSFHLKMNIEKYLKLIPNNFHIIQEDISCYANFADIFVSFYSSTAFISVFLTKKIVTIDLVNFQNDSYNENLKNNHLLTNLSDLRKLLENILIEDECEIVKSNLYSSLSQTFQKILREHSVDEAKK